jgi:cell division protein ZipA
VAELRWILLALGLALIAGLVVREFLRRSGRERETPPPEPRVESVIAAPVSAATPAPFRSPASRPARDPGADLPVIEIGDDVELDVSFARAAPGDARVEPRLDTLDDVDEAVSAPREVVPAVAAVTRPDTLRLEWPPEASRRIVALRISARGTERLPGRSLRQALAGEGLQHGPMEIFHWPLEDGRVVLSAASLTKPGVFRLASMDTERYAGINLFAVLPGPVGPHDAVDRLVSTARGLAARLDAEVCDATGAPLTPERLADMRRIAGAPSA